MAKHVELVVTIGGKAGQGVLSAGTFLESVFHSMGLYTFAWSDYPSLIKGGNNVMSIRVSTKPVSAPRYGIDLLVALDAPTIEIHEDNITRGGVCIYDSSIAQIDLSQKPTAGQRFHAVAVPLGEISRSIDKSTMYTNTAAIGAAHAVLGISAKNFEAALTAKYAKKSQKIVDNNLEAVRKSVKHVEMNFDRVKTLPSLSERAHPDHIILNGATAFAYGAIKAGLKFTAAYPMTPATPTFDILMKLAPEYQIVAKQAEDEISAVCMTVGASYAGARSMTMTSGGGFSLMVEALGLSGITETPLVVMNAMRGGPSTGLPTKTEQSDLRFVVHASHGEFPRVVIAPGDPEEAFYHTQRGFNLADKYQLPVLLLSDEYLATSRANFADFDLDRISVDRGVMISSKKELGGGEYQRFQVTKDGVSPRAVPGTAGLSFKAGSDEHNEQGEICEDRLNRVEQMDKRMRKEKSLLPEIPKPTLYGPKNADITLISWGSTKHACIEAMEIMKQYDVTVNVLHFIYVYPLDEKRLLPILSRLKKAVVVENNATAQFAGMLKEYVGFIADGHLLKYDGQPFYPEDIRSWVMKKFF